MQRYRIWRSHFKLAGLPWLCQAFSRLLCSGSNIPAWWLAQYLLGSVVHRTSCPAFYRGSSCWKHTGNLLHSKKNKRQFRQHQRTVSAYFLRRITHFKMAMYSRMVWFAELVPVSRSWFSYGSVQSLLGDRTKSHQNQHERGQTLLLCQPRQPQLKRPLYQHQVAIVWMWQTVRE